MHNPHDFDPDDFSDTISELQSALKALDMPVPDQGDENDPTYAFRLLMLLDAYAVCTRMGVAQHCTPDVIVRLKQNTQPYLELLAAMDDPHLFVAAERAHEAAMLVAPYTESAPGSPPAVVAVTLSAAADLFTGTMLDDVAAQEGMAVMVGGEPVVVPARARLLMDAREKVGAVHARLTKALIDHHAGSIPQSALVTAGCGSCSKS